jgi:alkanesulfonate monooxygenase SsuD/methylene tetrahydromethanopterin reductase-like flavin-dependent oxidoreductase (luciferase family)
MRPNPKALRSCASSSSVQFSPEKRDLREPLSIMSLRQNPMHSLKAMSTHGHRVASSRHLPGPRDRGFDLGDENLFHPSNIPCICMKKIGFLSFGHWTPSSQSETRSAQDVLLQSIDLAIEAERLGVDGAYFRVHHFARQLSSPFPLLAAVGARTQKIEIGTAVIDMRYENPHYMAEDAGSADLIAGSRLQLGISRGSPEQVIDGWRHFGYRLADGEDDAAMGRRHTEEFLELLRGEGFAQPNPRPMFANPPGLLRLEPHSETLRDRIWWGSASNATAIWAAKLGMNLQSSTLKFDESGEPLHIQQAAQIRAFRAAWAEAGHTRIPRVSVSRSIFALMNDLDRAYFGRTGEETDKIGFLDATTRAVFGRGYAAEPDVLIEQLQSDEAIAEADTLLLTVPNQLGVAYNVHVLEAILKTVAPALGWR